MKEHILHFIWQYQRFDHLDLLTEKGERVSVVHPGTLNHYDGPDFQNAKVMIDDTLWTGSVEIHIDGKDWYHHKHQHDEHYSNVVLHVVYKNATDTFNKGGFEIPSIELNSRVAPSLLHRFDEILANGNIIACANHIPNVKDIVLLSWKERLVAERLEEKVKDFEFIIDQMQGDWEGAFIKILVRNFGVYANTDAFELLAESIDHRILNKHHDNLFQLEAILFGQAGMLDRNFDDEYPAALKKEYEFIKIKYNLKSIPIGYWNFRQLRPMSFPTIRIAQLAALLHQHAQLFSLFIESASPFEILLDVSVSEYWQHHYTFDKISRSKTKRIGQTFANLLTINAFIPTLFAMGKAMCVPDLSIEAMELLYQLKPEENKKTNLWKELGVDCNNAADSQAMIQMINHYCAPKKCLKCAIGCHILRGDDYTPPQIVKEAELCYN